MKLYANFNTIFNHWFGSQVFSKNISKEQCEDTILVCHGWLHCFPKTLHSTYNICIFPIMLYIKQYFTLNNRQQTLTWRMFHEAVCRLYDITMGQWVQPK